MFDTSKYTPFITLSKARGHFYNSEIGYRFHFNGQESDNEVAGTGNIMTAEFWEYDTRLGRRWNIDPIEYPWQSGYATFNNNPNFFNDPLGLEGEKPNKESESTDKTYQSTDKKGESAIDYVKPNSENKNPPSLLYRIINSFKRHNTGPNGKWVKDKDYTELPGTFNPDNNTFSYSSSPNTSDRIISYMIINEPKEHDHFTNFSIWKLNGLIPNGNSQKTKTMNWGGHIPISPNLLFGEPKPTYSGYGNALALFGGTMMTLTSFQIVSGSTGRYAILMMTGASMSHRMNPAFRNFTNFEIRVYSNQTVTSGDIRMFVRYKRFIKYDNLTPQQKGFFKQLYYGY